MTESSSLNAAYAASSAGTRKPWETPAVARLDISGAENSLFPAVTDGPISEGS